MYDDINELVISGRLTQDPQIYEKVVSFSIATNKSVKNQNTGEWEQRADFFNAVYFTKEELSGHLREKLVMGQKVALTGSLTQDKWEDRKTGESKTSVKIITNRIKFLD